MKKIFLVLFVVLFPAIVSGYMSDDTSVSFLAPACLIPGAQQVFEVNVHYLGDQEAVAQAQYNIGYEWTFVQAYDPGAVSVPGDWVVTHPSNDIVNWTFDDEAGEGTGGLRNGESLTFVLEAVVSDEPDDNYVVFSLYGDEVGGVPPHELVREHTFSFCGPTTTTHPPTTTTTTGSTTTTQPPDDDTDDDVADDTDDDADDTGDDTTAVDDDTSGDDTASDDSGDDSEFDFSDDEAAPGDDDDDGGGCCG